MTYEIDDRVRQAVEKHPHPLVFASLSGAHLYGFPSEDSDWDIRGAHILPLGEVVRISRPDETFEDMREEDDLELDIVTHDVRKYFELLLKKNGNILEQLFSPHVLFTTPGHDHARAIASRCITHHHYHHYRGYAESRWSAFEEDEEREIKPLLYAFRVGLTGLHLMKTSEVVADINRLNELYPHPFIADLVDRKREGGEHAVLGDVDIEPYRDGFQRLMERLELAHEASSLPEQPLAAEELEELLVDLRLSQGALGAEVVPEPGD